MKYSMEPTAARKEPMINVTLITALMRMPMSWLVSKSLETARMAMLFCTLGPVLVVYPFFQRFFIKGMTVGAVKG